MQPTRRVVLEYIALVGIPIAGILIVLTIGRRLEGAVPIETRWELTSPTTRRALRCVDPVPARAAVLRLEQSGRYFDGHIRNRDGSNTTALAGTLNGSEIVLTGESTAPGCEGAVRLAIQVSPGEPRSMQGALTALGCPTCGVQPVMGVPRPTSRTLIPEDR